MEKVSEAEKKSLHHKLLAFQKAGLIAYGKYLSEQHALAAASASKQAYLSYIEDQLAQNAQQIQNIDDKLK